MYDELIKALRDPVHSLDCEFCDSRYCHPDRKGYGKCIIIKAADAIENMSEAYSKLSRHMDDLAALMPRWIPVTERLPNGEAERYLVAASLMSLGLRVSICYYADNLEEVDEYDFEGEKHSGFYGYDDEYGYYERSGVKYWMPLPEPPKGE